MGRSHVVDCAALPVYVSLLRLDRCGDAEVVRITIAVMARRPTQQLDEDTAAPAAAQQ